MTTIDEMKKLCDEATEGNLRSAVKVRFYACTFVPEAIRVMEQMAEALTHYRDKYERFETFDNTSHDTGGSGYEYIDGPAQKSLAAFDALGVE